MAEFVANYQEKVPPPAQVRIVFYDSKLGHEGVSPLGYVHHEDKTIVGTLAEGYGPDKQTVHVHQGDAIIEYPGYIYFRKPANEASAFYEPLQADLGAPALPEHIPEVDIDDLLKETP